MICVYYENNDLLCNSHFKLHEKLLWGPSGTLRMGWYETPMVGGGGTLGMGWFETSMLGGRGLPKNKLNGAHYGFKCTKISIVIGRVQSDGKCYSAWDQIWLNPI